MKDASVKVRLTQIEKELLQRKSKFYNMSLSDYIKYCCLIEPPKPYGFEREEEYKVNNIKLLPKVTK